MSAQEYIRSMVRGADLYRKQGLYSEARGKYLEALSLVSRTGETRGWDRLKEILEERIRAVEENLAAVSEVNGSPVLSEEVQDLIRDLFSFSQARERASIEGATALMKFGQHSRAIREFETLMKEGIQPLLAAKSILLCHLSLHSPEAAIARLRKWEGRNGLSIEEVGYLREFLESELAERGIHVELPRPATTPKEPHRKRAPSGPEITTVTIDFEDGALKDQSVELKVTFQFGNVLSIIVSAHEKGLLENMQVGKRFRRMGFYSSMAFFRGSGSITSRNMIKHGPRQGDILFDIMMDES
ncbi:MAG: hypothetical protein JXL84_24070 [Deltaproteobacteria bacterium]|nr:hypothetical protein [Deltaproteobacteria bacterium]